MRSKAIIVQVATNLSHESLSWNGVPVVNGFGRLTMSNVDTLSVTLTVPAGQMISASSLCIIACVPRLHHFAVSVYNLKLSSDRLLAARSHSHCTAYVCMCSTVNEGVAQVLQVANMSVARLGSNLVCFDQSATTFYYFTWHDKQTSSLILNLM